MRLPDSPPTLAEDPRTGTVRLRAHRPDDLDGLLTQSRDETSRRWTSIPVPYRRADGERFLTEAAGKWAGGQYLGWAVELDSRYAGTVDLRPRAGDVADIGYGLAPWARGRGVGERALRLLLPWAFDELELALVHWSAMVGNWASRRVAWSVGFRIGCQLPAWWDQRGQARTMWVGSLRRGSPLGPAHAWFDPPRLHLGPAVLRRHTDLDDVAMAEACDDPRTQYWLPLPSPYTVRQAREHLAEIDENLASGRALSWAIAEARDPDGPLRGEIAVQVGPDGRQGEIGYWAHPVVRGRGLTTAAVRLAARHALLPSADGGLGMSRVLLRIAEHNTASLRIAHRLGFHPSGVDRDGERLRDGTVQDMLRFDLLADECP